MIKRLIYTSICVLFSQLSVAQFTDNFTDGDFTNNPTWSGDVANFEVNIPLQLHLNAPAVADESYLSTPSVSMNNAVWEFYVEMDFNPSSANYAKVYLASCHFYHSIIFRYRKTESFKVLYRLQSWLLGKFSMVHALRVCKLLQVGLL